MTRTEKRIRTAIDELENGTFATHRHAMKASIEIAEKHKISGLLINEYSNGSVISAIGWTPKIRISA